MPSDRPLPSGPLGTRPPRLARLAAWLDPRRADTGRSDGLGHDNRVLRGAGPSQHNIARRGWKGKYCLQRTYGRWLPLACDALRAAPLRWSRIRDGAHKSASESLSLGAVHPGWAALVQPSRGRMVDRSLA